MFGSICICKWFVLQLGMGAGRTDNVFRRGGGARSNAGTHLAFGEPPVGSKEDLRKAYHQVARSRQHVRIVQLLLNPFRKKVFGREQFSQDFGNAGAVTCCNVVFRALRDIANRWLLVNLDNYFDDFWFWEPAWGAHSARFAVRRLFALLGYHFKPEKFRGGRRLPLLGLVFASQDEGPVVRNRARRREPLARELEELATSAPQPGAASSTIGKIIFASRGLQGKAGVHARRPMFAALKNADVAVQNGQWPLDMQVALKLWARLLRRGPARSLDLRPKSSLAAVLYGDAALSSGRAAAMLCIPAEGRDRSSVLAFLSSCHQRCSISLGLASMRSTALKFGGSHKA